MKNSPKQNISNFLEEFGKLNYKEKNDYLLKIETRFLDSKKYELENIEKSINLKKYLKVNVHLTHSLNSLGRNPSSYKNDWIKLKKQVFTKFKDITESELETNFETFIIGLQLKKIRKNLNLEFEYISKLTDIKITTLKRIENNSSSATLSNIYVYARKGLNCNIKIEIVEK